MLRVGLGALVRAAFVLFGTTVVAWWLGTRIEDGLNATGDSQGSAEAGIGFSARWADYWAAFGEALTLSSAISEALGRTMVTAAAGIFLGLVIGALFGLLLRIPKLGPVLGFLSVPTMALAIPGVALYPLARAANSLGWAESGSIDLSESFGDGLAFVGLWGLLAGLAIAPSVAAEVSRSAAATMIGPQTARGWSTVRAETALGPRFGLPTTGFVLAIATGEILSGHPGAFARLFDALDRRSLDETFQIVFWLAVAAAALVMAIGIATHFVGGDGSGPEQATAGAGVDIGTGTARPLLMTLIILGTLLLGVAVAGSLANPTGRDAAAVLVDPTFGGPWLGTDAVGRGVAHLSAVGLWPAVVAGAIPAAIATALGAIIALIVVHAPRALARVVDTVTDVAWWPLPAVLPLAFVALDGGGRLGLSWRFLLFTGLALTPLAARLTTTLLRSEPGRRPALIGSTLFFCSAVAVSVHVLLGFAGFGGGDERPQLGTAIRAGLETYDSSIWPYIVPTAAAALLAATLYGLAASLTVPEVAKAAAPVEPDGTTSWLQDPDLDSAAQTNSVGKADATEQFDWQPPVGLPDPRLDEDFPDMPAPIKLEPLVPVGAETDSDSETDSGLEKDSGLETATESEAETGAASADETRQFVAAGTVAAAEDAEGQQSDDGDSVVIDLTDAPDADEGPQPPDEPSVLEQATRTIELRPSKLREAGIMAAATDAQQQPLTNSWPKLDLAPRPGATTTESSSQDETDPEPDEAP